MSRKQPTRLLKSLDVAHRLGLGTAACLDSPRRLLRLERRQPAELRIGEPRLGEGSLQIGLSPSHALPDTVIRQRPAEQTWPFPVRQSIPARRYPPTAEGVGLGGLKAAEGPPGP